MPVDGDVIAGLVVRSRTDPVAAEADARAVLAARDDGEEPLALAQLQWVIGLGRREAGALGESREALDAAVALAHDGGDDRLAARIESSLAFLIGQEGDVAAAIDRLNAIAPRLDGVDHAGVLGQLGVMLCWQGELAAGTDLLERCCTGYRDAGEQALEARFRANLGAALSMSADLDRAERELRHAARMSEELGASAEAGMAWSNLGFVATLRGDLPTALAAFARGEALFGTAGAESLMPALHADHARALAQAGLFDDSVALADQAIGMYRDHGQLTELAGALLAAAEIGLARGDLDGASGAAEEARDAFARQGRPGWAAVASALGLEAVARRGLPGGEVLAAARELERVARELATHDRWSEAVRAGLTALRLAAGAGHVVVVPPELRAAVRRTRTGDRILLAAVDAQLAMNRHEPGPARRAIGRGLRLATSAQAGLGSIETRAHAAAHGHELVEMGARLAIADRRPRELLARIEATRVISSRMPSVRPSADPAVAGLLAELRRLEVTLADPASEPEQRREADRNRRRVEREVRRHTRVARGDGAVVDLAAEIGDAIERLGDRQLLAHAALDGQLHAVSVRHGRVRLHELGGLEAVRAAVEGVAFALNRLNRVGGSPESRLAAAEMLFGLSDDLADLLLPASVADDVGPLVVVPTAVLHDVPWALLPPLAGRAVSVNASLTGWASAVRRREERMLDPTGRVGFVAGPGLDYAELEVEAIAAYYSGPDVLVGADTTVEHGLDLFALADVAHVACHGHFRSDNPLFSSIHLADGPLSVYDFERLDRLPMTVILSACSVAGAKVLQGGSVLGLAAALTTLGVASVIAPLTPISDASSVEVMQRVHRELVGGVAPAAALAAAVLAHDMADPTAGAFIALRRVIVADGTRLAKRNRLNVL